MKYVLDVHTHTLASGHAYNTMREMARAAADKGLELLGITEHGVRMQGACHEFYFHNLRMVDRQMEGISLLLGVELNIMDYDGTVDMPPEVLREMDIRIASMHVPCIKPGSIEENTRAFLNAMKNPYVDIIGHPDDSRFPIDFKALVEGAKETQTLLEVNNGSLDSRSFREGAAENYLQLLELCRAYEVPVVIGSDAHADTLVGRHDFAEELMRQVDFPTELIVNRSVAELKKFLYTNKREGRES